MKIKIFCLYKLLHILFPIQVQKEKLSNKIKNSLLYQAIGVLLDLEQHVCIFSDPPLARDISSGAVQRPNGSQAVKQPGRQSLSWG